MRSDYLLYLLAVVFLLIAVTSIVLVPDERQRTLWTVSSIVLGFVSAGLGYYERPKPKAIAAKTSEVQPAELVDPHPCFSTLSAKWLSLMCGSTSSAG
jgi:hypothetical protein